MRALLSMALLTAIFAAAMSAGLIALEESSQESQSTPTSQAPSSSTPQGRGQTRVVIDGKSNPEQIPDDAAIAMLIPSWAIPANASDAEERRLRNLTSRMELSSGDFKILRNELARVYPRIAQLQNQTRASRTSPDVRNSMEELRELSVETYGRLLEFMSPNGAKKLQEHLAYRKSRTTVTATSPPSR